VPKDDLSLPRLPPTALSPGARALLKSQQDQIAGLGTLRPSAREPRPAVEFARKQLTEHRRAIAALERDLAARWQELEALELEIAGRREAARTVEEWLARGGRTPDPPRATSPRAKTQAPAVSTAPDPSPTPEPEQIGHPAPEEEKQDGPQTALTRLFFQEVFGGPPSKKWGCRRLHERMKEWVAEKNKADGGTRIAASETTIRNVRKAL
jgi:hypothetical protein